MALRCYHPSPRSSEPSDVQRRGGLDLAMWDVVVCRVDVCDTVIHRNKDESGRYVDDICLCFRHFFGRTDPGRGSIHRQFLILVRYVRAIFQWHVCAWMSLKMISLGMINMDELVISYIFMGWTDRYRGSHSIDWLWKLCDKHGMLWLEVLKANNIVHSYSPFGELYICFLVIPRSTMENKWWHVKIVTIFITCAWNFLIRFYTFNMVTFWKLCVHMRFRQLMEHMICWQHHRYCTSLPVLVT